MSFDTEEYEEYGQGGQRDELCTGADLAADERAAETADHHEQPVHGSDGAADGSSSGGTCSERALTAGIGEEEVQLRRDADLDTHVEEDGQDAEHAVAELPRAGLVLDGLALLGRLGDLHQGNDDESDGEYGHGDEEQRSHVGHRGLVSDGTDEDTHEERGEGSGEGIHGTTDLDVLVALVATAAEDVQHRVDNGVEHTDAEAADECTEEVNDQGEHVASDLTGEPLHEYADETYGEGDKRGLLVTDLHQHLSGGNTHEEVCGEVHEVAEHAGVGELDLPDVAERSGHVGHEGYHREDETHRDDRY